ncbi:hypothetical protein G4O51_11885 [Candidatus Bathyarchaeota archaeon A05DMB-2]|nr:hypothetical protein [Candidatus Bathyarchaeota archaeon A05DMB-2]
MERELKMKGKEFARCQGCPALLGFNLQKSKSRDVVYVKCLVEECIKPVAECEVSVQYTEKNTEKKQEVK